MDDQQHAADRNKAFSLNCSRHRNVFVLPRRFLLPKLPITDLNSYKVKANNKRFSSKKKMGFISMIEHESRTDVDVVKTTYKWHLPFWSLLSEYYAHGVQSSEFHVMESENYKCQLKFSYLHWTARIQIICTCPQKHSIGATLSIVDESMEKLRTASCSNIMSTSKLSLVEIDPIDLSDYLQNDTLILYFEFWIVKAANEIQLYRTTYEERFDDKLFSDVTFVVEGVKLTAHKLILSENSDVFKAMFTTGMQDEKESLVEIEGVDPKIFEIFLKFVYTGKTEDIDTIVTELLIVSKRYQVTDLITVCENNMKRQLSVDNATSYLSIAHQLGCMSLEDRAVKFLKCNTQIFADPDQYKLLSDCPALFKRMFGKTDRE